MNRKSALLIVLAGIILIGLCLWSPVKDLALRARAASPNPAGASARPQMDAPRPAIRFVRDPEPVPAFLIQDLQGNPVSPADWKGKVTLLTFWATWCGPCREEIPELVELEKRYPGQVQVIGLSVDEDPAWVVKQFVSREGINYPVAMATPQIMKEFGGVPALPTTYVVNQKVGIVQKHVGLYSAAVFDREIRALLGMPVDAPIETFVDEGQIFLKNAANATELPGVDLSKLTEPQKLAVLKRLNSEDCTCGCKMTLAQCRINDTTCPISKKTAAEIVDEVRTGKKAPAAPAPADSATPTESGAQTN